MAVTPISLTPGVLAEALVDLGAIEHNVRLLCEQAGGAQVMAVVKADGYGHGAPQTARAALAAGATELGVATVAEGLALRAAGLLAQQPHVVLNRAQVDQGLGEDARCQGYRRNGQGSRAPLVYLSVRSRHCPRTGRTHRSPTADGPHPAGAALSQWSHPPLAPRPRVDRELPASQRQTAASARRRARCRSEAGIHAHASPPPGPLWPV
ncbi:hypothetical protein A5653_21210 [Mycobacterium colombiense]|uniref:alanine racemase n=1 Tax=Mycobacterium colombiense TaxID=339268 RepID=UPI0007F02402|nr:hypothetical protein A5653_21210 [Mycobacterium colombiense]